MAKQPITPRKTVAAPSPRRALWPLLAGAAALVLILLGVAVLMRPEGETASPSSPQTADVPQLTVDRELIDFGEVPVEKIVKATFLLENTGGETLNFLNQPQVRVVEGC
jgi:hypothetical protein